MPKNINALLKEVLTEIKPSEKEMKGMENSTLALLKKIKGNMQGKKINADIFVGGSAAKATMIKKDPYDIDIFIRFDKKYKNEILSDLTEKILRGIGRNVRIHGSRDYFKIKFREKVFFEIVPVKRIQNPREAENVTDLSYSHVNYIKKKIKSEKLLDEIRLAKAFCYANNAYGAESYVRGFSGYGLELLVYHYGSFLKFVREIAKIKEKTVIDIEKHHKNKDRILMDLNEAKLQSPIILVDPTYKQRNVLAALSAETLENFQKACRLFLQNPKISFFKQRPINTEKLRADSKNKGYDFIVLKITTNKQEGDVAGSKLLKFYRHIREELEKFYDIKENGFEYKNGKSAQGFFAVKRKPLILVIGPMVNDIKNTNRFKSAHKSVFIKNNRLYSKKANSLPIKSFIEFWKKKNRKRMKDMSIIKMELV